MSHVYRIKITTIVEDGLKSKKSDTQTTFKKRYDIHLITLKKKKKLHTYLVALDREKHMTYLKL